MPTKAAYFFGSVICTVNSVMPSEMNAPQAMPKKVRSIELPRETRESISDSLRRYIFISRCANETLTGEYGPGSGIGVSGSAGLPDKLNHLHNNPSIALKFLEKIVAFYVTANEKIQAVLECCDVSLHFIVEEAGSKILIWHEGQNLSGKPVGVPSDLYGGEHNEIQLIDNGGHVLFSSVAPDVAGR